MADSLRIILKLGSIVLVGHGLDKHVLHRDLKPANVMLRAAKSDSDEAEVVVLDFDLSRYEGAIGRSVMQVAHLHNYIAPEQAVRQPGVSSRHTAVDVFGLSMLAYFACTRQHPEINVQRRAGFRAHVIEAIEHAWNAWNAGLVEYLAMVIEAAAADEQRRRPLLPMFIKQIEAVTDALASGRLEAPSDLANVVVAAPLMADGWEGLLSLEDPKQIVLKRNECRLSMEFGDEGLETFYSVELTYSHGGQIERSRAKKYGQTKAEQACAMLRKDSLFDVKAVSGQVITVYGRSGTDNWSVNHAQRLSAALLDAANTLAFVDG